MDNYVVVGSKPWSRQAFDETICKLPGQWIYMDSPSELTFEGLSEIAPQAIFFLHWSSRIPDEIVSTFICVCFHMTDVPYGRGGSPLQNLILRGHRETKLTALRMTGHFDAGPVYFKRDLSLEGSAQEIYQRASKLAAAMIEQWIIEKPQPISQTGDPVVFRRRTPDQSELPLSLSHDEIYDFIRMLDADGYPRAFLDHGDYRLEFSDAEIGESEVLAKVRITRPTGKQQ